MTYKYDVYDVMIAPGGTNIEKRMHPTVVRYKHRETPVVMFVGRRQGEEAVRYFRSHGVPCFSEETGRGYIVFKNDTSATTKQNAYFARVGIERFSLGNRICVSTEFHHGKRALRDFKWLFPEPEYKVGLVTVDSTGKSPKELALRFLHEPISLFFDMFYLDLPRPARTPEDAFKVYSRNKVLQPVLDKIRGYESGMFSAVGSKSEKALKGTLIDERGKLLMG